jgi:hypothetical protein
MHKHVVRVNDTWIVWKVQYQITPEVLMHTVSCPLLSNIALESDASKMNTRVFYEDINCREKCPTHPI